MSTKARRGTLRKDRARKALGISKPGAKARKTAAKLPQPEPTEQTVGPTPPRGSPPAVVEFYRVYAPLLVEKGLLDATDYASFELMAQNYGIAVEAMRVVMKEGYFRLDEQKIQRKHPGIQVHRDATMTFTRLASRFGLTPIDRARVTPRDEEKEDPFEAFVRERLTQA